MVTRPSADREEYNRADAAGRQRLAEIMARFNKPPEPFVPPQPNRTWTEMPPMSVPADRPQVIPGNPNLDPQNPNAADRIVTPDANFGARINFADNFITDDPEWARRFSEEQADQAGARRSADAERDRLRDEMERASAVRRERNFSLSQADRNSPPVPSTPVMTPAGWRIYNAPAVDRLTIEDREKGLWKVYMGSEFVYPAPYQSGDRVEREYTMSLEEAKYFHSLPPEIKQAAIEMIWKYYEGQRREIPVGWLEGRWEAAVEEAAFQYNVHGKRVSPLEVYEDTIAMDALLNSALNSTSSRYGRGGRGSGGGGGGAQVRLTSPSDARALLNQAMSQYLGRQASGEEIEQFVAALNAQERANPVNVTFEGGVAVQSGGFNPATFAEDFARSQEGSSEFQAATTLLDAFFDALTDQNRLV